MDLAHNAEIALRMVRERPLIVFDVETSGLDWRHNAPIGYVVGEGVPGGECVYVPIRHGGGGNLPGGVAMTDPKEKWQVHEFEKELAQAFRERNQAAFTHCTIGHHIKFDAHFAANAGVMLGRQLADTQDMEAILFEYAPSFSLADCATRRGVTAKKGEELYQHLANQFRVPATRSAMAHYWKLAGNDPIGYEYAIGDGHTTAELYHVQAKQIHEENLDAVWQLESELIWTCFRMERKGIATDPSVIGELVDATEQRIAQDIKFFGEGFNVRSPKMVQEVMEQNGHLDWPTTDKGNPSFTEKWLKSHAVGKRIIGRSDGWRIR